MRILYVTSAYSGFDDEPAGGVAVAAGRLARAVSEVGASVDVLLMGTVTRTWRDGGVTVHEYRAVERGLHVRGVSQLRDQLQRVASGSEFDLVHGQGLFPAGAAVASAGLGVPAVATVHGNPWKDVPPRIREPRQLARVLLAVRQNKSAIARLDLVVNPCPDFGVNMVAEGQSVVFIPNPLDGAFLQGDSGLPRRQTDVLYLGGGRAVKGPDVLAAAWAAVVERVPGARLLLSDHLGVPLPNAVMLDRCDSAGVRNWMSRAGALVVPSRYEVAPNVIYEAWASGLPVVATAVGGIPAMAGDAIRLVPPEDPAALASALEETILDGAHSNDARVARGLSLATAASPERVAHAHLALYHALLGHH